MWVEVFMEGSQMLYASWLAQVFFFFSKHNAGADITC